ncbi:FAD-binding oxidoreductase [Ruegeria sp.]|uniref:NAD(P)/FAD-dependent oxidoreductase n=1 Tax=Ruegeria sp. TaxID=1879320 RepID=UPI002325396B|nr:FAD-binding oxidoreductase [Ruegeria sp.]MDA7965810.1 FAD-binding oxidoreductase [Ruegeria sp.]
MTAKFDTIIVGGGIVGATAAYYLAKAGKRVALFEKGRIAGEQSSRNWGAVRVQGRDPSQVPMMLDCLDIWRGIEAELGEDIDWRQNGQMRVGYSDADVGRMEAVVDQARELGYGSRLLTRAETEALLPHFNGDGMKAALYNPDDGCAEPEKAAPAFARGAARLGAEIHDFTAVTSVEASGGQVSGVWTEKGLYEAETVILASGAWTRLLLKPLGVSHPSLWIRGSVARTAPVPIEMRQMVVWGRTAYRQLPDGRVNIAVSEDGFHDLMIDSLFYGFKFLPLAVKNWRNLRLNLGRTMVQNLMGDYADFTTHRTLDPRPDWRGLERARKLFQQDYPAAGELRYERAWAGQIDYMPDELPVIDQAHNLPGLFIAAGLSGNGFGIGPVVGRILRDLIVNGQSKYDLTPFSMQRFGR